MDFLPPAFAAMSEFDQFILYQLKPKANSNKSDKIPLNPVTLKPASALDSKSWMRAQDAIERSQAAGLGVGFAFTKRDPFFFVDVDNALDERTNQWNDTATDVCTLFDGAAVEVSSSGRGLHVFGTAPARPHKCKSKGLEFYTHDRFVALTGTHARGNAGADMTRPLDAFIDKYGFASTPGTATPFDSTSEPDDERLLARALSSRSKRSVFGGGASFKDLWTRNTQALGKAYPDATRGFDESAADAALAQHLAFWTNSDKERMLRLMLKSGLVREKWDREDYLPRTIEGACGRQQDRLTIQPSPQSTENKYKSQLRSTTSIMSVNDQLAFFDGCVYVMDDHKIFVPGGYSVNPERFRTLFGGHSFIMDNDREKTTSNAWEAYTESRAIEHPRAHSSTFKPNVAPGEIIEKDGERFINTYWPVKTPRALGDITPFMNHLCLILPEVHDREVLLSYMAAVVQHKGVKFQWCPFLQGVEGNGKTVLSQCVAFAIGERYSHWPKASEISGKFNDWLYAKIFIAVEDIYMPSGKLEIMEILKPMITSSRQEIEPKGGAKVTRDICANFLINSNHKDGLRKTRDGRRFAPLYTAQQTLYDLEVSNMRGNYFVNLFKWLHSGGFAYVSEFLHTYAIPDDYNPAFVDRAPVTTSTEAAIHEGTGRIEQEILEAVEEGEIGFRGGWISSIWLDRLLDKHRAQHLINRNKRRNMLEELGYSLHPGLREGRANNVIEPDKGRPSLYIKYNSEHRSITAPVDIVKQYTRDQTL